MTRKPPGEARPRFKPGRTTRRRSDSYPGNYPPRPGQNPAPPGRSMAHFPRPPTRPPSTGGGRGCSAVLWLWIIVLALLIYLYWRSTR